MMNNQLTLPVSTGTNTVGKIGRISNGGGCFFNYLDDCAPEAAISLTMPPKPDPYLWESGLHPIFDMNLPEGDLRAEIVRQFSKAIPNFDDFDLLRIVGSHQLGRIRIGSSTNDMPEIDIRALTIYDGSADLATELISQYAQYYTKSLRDLLTLSSAVHSSGTPAPSIITTSLAPNRISFVDQANSFGQKLSDFRPLWTVSYSDMV